jgi:hypothetical protein
MSKIITKKIEKHNFHPFDVYHLENSKSCILKEVGDNLIFTKPDSTLEKTLEDSKNLIFVYGYDDSSNSGYICKTDENESFGIKDTVYFNISDCLGTTQVKSDSAREGRETIYVIEPKKLFGTDVQLKNDLNKEEVKPISETSIDKGTADKVETVSSDRSIPDFIKLVSLMGGLYDKNSEKLKRHLRKAYVECSMYDTIKSRFNKTDEEAENIFQAFMGVEWLVKEASPKWSYENARKKVSEETGIGVEIFRSLSGSYSSYNKHKKEI